MKTTVLLLALLFSIPVFAQKNNAPVHGMIYGARPDTTGVMDARKVEAYMDKKTRMSMVIRGKVIRVTKSKNGWFEIDGGNGRVISAHFKNIGVNLPLSLKGKTVIMDCEVQKQFIADDQQHFAGDTVTGKKQHGVKTNSKRRLSLEVKGMMVD